MRDDLYREICRNPEDDTLRLAYADWLDETGDPDRAEFVRVQCELNRWGSDSVGSIIYSEHVNSLCRREVDIRAAHPEWSRCPCEKCGDKGWAPATIGYGYSREWEAYCRCGTCSGTGDLFFMPRTDFRASTPDEWGRDLAGTIDPRTVTFARGFPDSVTCTLAEAFTPDGTPTSWACEVVRRTPVTRFVLTDADPPGRDSGDRQYPFHWRDTMFTHGSGYVIADQCDKNYRTEERALDVFALAAGRLVRRHVYGGEA